jgi:hypothetical protein
VLVTFVHKFNGRVELRVSGEGVVQVFDLELEEGLHGESGSDVDWPSSANPILDA